MRALVRRFSALGAKRLALAGTAAAVAVAALVAGVLLSGDDGGPPIPDTRARAYRNVDACLLTGKDGITAGTQAAAVWLGMQHASLKTHVRVSYAPVTGRQSTAAARPFLNSMLQRSCDVVVATGTSEVRAAEEAATAHRGVRFVLVQAGKATAQNLTYVRPGEGLASEVTNAVARAVRHDGKKK